MSIEDINNNPKVAREWIERAKKSAVDYYKKHPDSLIPVFEEELKKMMTINNAVIPSSGMDVQ